VIETGTEMADAKRRGFAHPDGGSATTSSTAAVLAPMAARQPPPVTRLSRLSSIAGTGGFAKLLQRWPASASFLRGFAKLLQRWPASAPFLRGFAKLLQRWPASAAFLRGGHHQAPRPLTGLERSFGSNRGGREGGGRLLATSVSANRRRDVPKAPIRFRMLVTLDRRPATDDPGSARPATDDPGSARPATDDPGPGGLRPMTRALRGLRPTTGGQRPAACG
jgi:hypothetical protein